MAAYHRPETLEHALSLLGSSLRPAILAGGTDFYPPRVDPRPDDDVLDITALDALQGIDKAGGVIRIGALATWSELVATPLPAAFDGLKRAAREIGGRQIQNAGMIVGNICNASPAADGIPCLLALDAEVVLTSLAGERRLPIGDFVLGNRQTARQPGELVTAIHVPEPAPTARATFLKLGSRAYLVISIVMLSIVLERAAGGTVGRARVAVGACSPVALRLPDLEAALVGAAWGAGLAAVPMPGHLAPLSPIDDVRATAAYRRDAALTLLRRALSELGTSE